MRFEVSEALQQEGIKAKMMLCSVSEVVRGQSRDFKAAVRKVVESIDFDRQLNSPIIVECKKWYERAGIVGAEAPAEHLLKILQRTGNLPNINRPVDAYNLASAETLVSLGAHDIAFVEGDLRIDFVKGDEVYFPLGSKDAERVYPSEYACMDDRQILCLMDLKQCDPTKVTLDTREFLVYAQGNREVTDDLVQETLEKVRANLEEFCSARCVIL